MQTASVNVGDDLLSHALSRAVQSALRGLTSVFGMGTGISPAVKSPASLAWALYFAPLGPQRRDCLTQDLLTPIFKELSPPFFASDSRVLIRVNPWLKVLADDLSQLNSIRNFRY